MQVTENPGWKNANITSKSKFLLIVKNKVWSFF